MSANTDDTPTDEPTEYRYDAADYENDVTLRYNVEGDLGRVVSEFEELQDAAKGAKVTGYGSTGTFNAGHYVGDEPATVSKTFTVTMDVPAWVIQKMRDRLEAFGGDDVDVDVEIDVSGSTHRGVPLWKDGRLVAAKSVPDLDEDEYDYTGKVTVTADITALMQGADEDDILEGDFVRTPHDDRLGKVSSRFTYSEKPDEAFVVYDEDAWDGGPVSNDDSDRLPVEDCELVERGDH